MTTPPIRTMTPLQIAKHQAVTFWDKLLTGWVPAWKCPPADKITNIARERTPVVASAPVPWTKLYDLPVSVAPSRFSIVEGSPIQSGMPMEQVTTSTPLRQVFVDSPNRGKPRVELVPIAKGEAWLEGMPQWGGAYDRHWLGVYPDGATVEMIQARWVWNPMVGGDGWAWWCDEIGFWNPAGELTSGYPVTAAGVRLSSMILTPDLLDNPAVIGCVFPNYAGRDGDDHSAPVSIGDRFRLPNPPGPEVKGDLRKLLMLLHTHGVRVFDRSPGGRGVGLVTQAGAVWPGSNIGELKLRTTDFERVVA